MIFASRWCKDQADVLPATLNTPVPISACIYLHGELEEKVGYDIVELQDATGLDVTKKYFGQRVFVRKNDAETLEGRLFMWPVLLWGHDPASNRRTPCIHLQGIILDVDDASDTSLDYIDRIDEEYTLKCSRISM